MIDMKTLAAAAAVAAATLAAGTLSASAQSTLTNGPNGMQPNRLSSDSVTGINGNSPSRGIYKRNNNMNRRITMRRHRSMDEQASPAMHTSYAYRRPLTVRRTVVAEPVVVATPGPVVGGPGPFAGGPGAIIGGTFGFANSIIALPFRVIDGIFPSSGDVASNPLVLIGAPLHAIGNLVQAPLRAIAPGQENPPAGTRLTTY